MSKYINKKQQISSSYEDKKYLFNINKPKSKLGVWTYEDEWVFTPLEKEDVK